MELDIAGQAVIKNISVRAEHHGEERELGVDIKLVLRTDLDALVNFSPALKALLYENADDAERRRLRMPELKPLGFTLEFPNHSLCIADQTWDGTTISKFEIAPEVDGAVAVTMTASMSQVDPAILPAIAMLWLDETVNIDIQPSQGDLFNGKEAA